MNNNTQYRDTISRSIVFKRDVYSALKKYAENNNTTPSLLIEDMFKQLIKGNNNGE